MSKKQTKAERAIESLQGYIDVLKDVGDRDTGESWKTSVIEILRKYLDKDSTFITAIRESVWTKKIEQWQVKDRYEFNPEKRAHFRMLVNGAIEYIEHHGVYEAPKPSKSNWLSNLNNWQLIAAISPVVAVGCTVSVIVTNATKSEKYFDRSTC